MAIVDIHYRCNEGIWEKKVPNDPHPLYRDWVPLNVNAKYTICNWIDDVNEEGNMVLHREPDIKLNEAVGILGRQT